MPRTLTLPIDADAVRELRVGDEVLLCGRLVTAREAAHRHLVKALDVRVKALAEGGAIYHCGPVVAQDAGGGWRLVAAGPTASSRMEPWAADVVARYGVRAIVGKGGMGPGTLAALARHGAVYLHALGGLAVTLARRVEKVHGVLLLDELGVAEAIWHVEVKDFPAVVTMDAHGESLHARAGAGEEPRAPTDAGER